MRVCRSRLGGYIWDQRSIRGIKRTALAEMIGCERESIILIEDRGDDVEGILPKLMDLLELDPRVVEKRKKQDQNLRRAWLGFCGGHQPPMIIVGRTTVSSTHEVPVEIVRQGICEVENYAKGFARRRNRTVELFVRNHIRFVISPSGEVDINELGIYSPWLDEMVEL